MIIYSSVLFLIGTTLAGIALISYPAGERTYILLATGSLMLLSLILFIHSFIKKKQPDYTPEKFNFCFPRIGIVLGLSILYIGGLQFLGFVIATIVFAILCMWFLGYKKLIWVLIIATGCTAVLYIGFKIGLGVPLPAGRLLSL